MRVLVIDRTEDRTVWVQSPRQKGWPRRICSSSPVMNNQESGISLGKRSLPWAEESPGSSQWRSYHSTGDKALPLPWSGNFAWPPRDHQKSDAQPRIPLRLWWSPEPYPEPCISEIAIRHPPWWRCFAKSSSTVSIFVVVPSRKTRCR